MNLGSLDREFSRIIRDLAGWRCARCGRDFEGAKDLLHCSHFFSRWNHSVRFDPDNCDALCWECHAYFDRNPREHEGWKEIRLGWEKFAELRRRAARVCKLDSRLVRASMRSLRGRAA